MAVEGVVVPQKEGIPTCRDGTLLKKEAWLIFRVSGWGFALGRPNVLFRSGGGIQKQGPKPSGGFLAEVVGLLGQTRVTQETPEVVGLEALGQRSSGGNRGCLCGI